MPVRFIATLIALLAGAFASVPALAASEGPRIALVECKPEPPMTRLVTVAPDGSARRVLPLAGVQPVPFEGPVWTADGAALVFAGYRVDPEGTPLENGRPRIFTVGSAGGEPQPVPGTEGGSHPLLSPDGRTVAFKRVKFRHRFDPADPLSFGSYFSATIWVVPLAGGRPQRLTRWKDGLVNEPAAFAPDGSTLLFERSRAPGSHPEIVARNLAGGPLRVLFRDAEDPAYSPDGARIALVSYRDRQFYESPDGPEPVGELYLARADGTQLRRLTRTAAAQELQPSWDPSGTRISFLRIRGPGGLGFGSRLFQVNPDGSCARRVTGAPGRRGAALYGPAWQPGLGRVVAPLAC